MLTLRLLAFISLLPLIYPLYKLIKRKELNLFDLVIVFSSLYYCVIPLVSSSENYNYSEIVNSQYIQFSIYSFYNLFIYSLFFFNIIWSISSFNKKVHLINLSHSIEVYFRKIIIPPNILYLYVFFVIIGWIIYVYTLSASALTANLSYTDIRESLADNKNYQGSVALTIFNYLNSVIFSILIFDILKIKKLRKKIPIIYWIILANFLTISMLSSRTSFLGKLIFVALVYYSLERLSFKWKNALKLFIVLFLVIGIVFPLVNIYRNSVRILGAEATNKNLIENFGFILNTTINNYSEMNKESSNAVGSRSVYVFQAFSSAFIINDEPELGNLSSNAISFSTPHFIYPGKSITGSQLIIEKKLKVYTDIADSFLLFNKLEWGTLGAFICVLFFIFHFICWDLLLKIGISVLKNKILFFFPLISVFAICHDVELSPDTSIANLIQAPFVLFSIFLLFYILRTLNRIVWLK